MATRKRNSTTRKTKKQRMQEMEKAENFRREVTLWIIVAISLLLFISNFGVGGKIGNAVSGVFFGIFGLVAYIFPVILLVGSFFVVSNKDNRFAILKTIAAILMLIALCMLMSLIVFSDTLPSPVEAFRYSREHKTAGGFLGGGFAYMLVNAFGKIGAYIIDVVLMIICLVIITEKSAISGMKKGGEKVVTSAKKNNERYQEYREYKAQEREQKRMDKKVSGVAPDLSVKKAAAGKKASDGMSEITSGVIEGQPEVSDEKHVALSSASDDMKPIGAVTVEPVISGNFAKDSEVLPEIVSPESLFNEKELASTTASGETQATRSTKTSPEEMHRQVSEVASEIEAAKPVKKYVFPPISLLKRGDGKKAGNTERQLRETANKLQQTLKTFGVNVTVTNISCGPAVTRYEIQPEMGVKVSKIVGLADDIKLNLAAADIRIEAPIPGKAAVGIEVPNAENVTVSFRELIESEEFKQSKSNITFAVGKDIAGKVKVADIAKMPHLLIAGATGSGKSVCINTIIMSILYKANPNDVKLIMIDPKVVELSVYNGIPHLMIPVVTDPKKAAGALNWAVAEMTERYDKFAQAGVRDLAGYNAKIESIQVPEGQERPEKLPQIVIIVDELADLMMVASGDVEESICRLAQLARACGIHLIIATQRPSVNVITGLIKANMPSRIAFAVSSGVDSRTILDMIGAEKLLGKGDMLFYPQGIPKPLRVQGAFVSDKEVADVVSFLAKENGQANYSEEIQKKVDSMENSSNSTVSIADADSGSDGRDSFFVEAAKIIIDKDKASIGMLQRYLKVGFNRAARIMDQLEEAGVVGPEEGTKPRKVLMSPDELQQFIEESM